jgi:hypothetical protein
MYAKIKEEIGQEYYRQNFPNDGQRFVAWYLRNIHLRDMNQAKAEITDGADDKQIDAIFVDDDNSTVYVVQGKFVGVDAIDAEPLREVLSSWIQLKDLVRLQETANNKLKQRLSWKRFGPPAFHIVEGLSRREHQPRQMRFTMR